MEGKYRKVEVMDQPLLMENSMKAKGNDLMIKEIRDL
jgi:hypothetical protein